MYTQCIREHSLQEIASHCLASVRSQRGMETSIEQAARLPRVFGYTTLLPLAAACEFVHVSGMPCFLSAQAPGHSFVCGPVKAFHLQGQVVGVPNRRPQCRKITGMLLRSWRFRRFCRAVYFSAVQRPALDWRRQQQQNPEPLALSGGHTCFAGQSPSQSWTLVSRSGKQLTWEILGFDQVVGSSQWRTLRMGHRAGREAANGTCAWGRARWESAASGSSGRSSAAAAAYGPGSVQPDEHQFNMLVSTVLRLRKLVVRGRKSAPMWVLKLPLGLKKLRSHDDPETIRAFADILGSLMQPTDRPPVDHLKTHEYTSSLTINMLTMNHGHLTRNPKLNGREVRNMAMKDRPIVKMLMQNSAHILCLNEADAFLQESVLGNHIRDVQMFLRNRGKLH